jgi:YVTN family beta-propeller protein
MKQLKQNVLFIALALCAVLASCHKNDDTQVNTVPAINGLYVLNQGGISKGNSTLSFYDFGSKVATASVFSVVNGRVLGDTGNDVEVYGSKTYIVVSETSVIEVINTQTAKSIATVTMNGANGVANAPRKPRSIVFYKNNAYITTYDDNVAVMDTATLTISKYISVGRDPEQEVISNGKLYVANSGGLDYGNLDNRVSVIDLATQTEIKKITVGLDPVNVIATPYNEVYVLSQNVYGANFSITSPSSITVINTTTDVAGPITPTDLGYAANLVTISGDLMYYFAGDNKIKVYNVKTKTAVSASFITDGTVLSSPYAITVNDATGEVYASDALDYASSGTVYAFDKTGKKEYSFKAGISPGKILLIKN